ncbi:hypothetical protein BU17DRAFT_83505 [Hysterangium stoloniferum]|nr:hypothetical protein BU17DRAFT_83505 [Hysterangium stoloniferum]
MTSADIVSLLDRLKGPHFSQNDLAWMWDLPTGKDLLEFLAAQVQGNSEFVIDDIALEEEEYDLWNRAVEAGLVVVEPPSSSGEEASYLPGEYNPPSILQMELDDIEKEQRLMDIELSRLNQRITRAREVAVQASKSHKHISLVQKDTSRSVTRLEEQLSQFSLAADSTVSSTVRVACHLVADHLALEQDVKRNQELIDLLVLLSGTYTNIAQLLAMHTSTDSCESLSNNAAHLLQEEVQRLSKTIVSFEHRYIAASNEGDHKSHSNNDGLAEQRIKESTWVEDTTGRIWNAEQASNLSKKLEIFRKETLVIIQALLDELDDIEVDISRTHDTRTLETDVQSLDAAVRELLKQLRFLRPSGLPPLTLIDHSDILTELHGIRSRYEGLRTDMKKMELGGAIDAHAMTTNSRNHLSNFLKHSPMNTTPPVSLSPDIQQEVYKAMQQIAEVSQVLSDTPNVNVPVFVFLQNQ